MVSLARKNLLEDSPRFFVALSGIVFAITLLTVQLGIFNGFISSIALPIQESNADLWLSARQMSYFEITLPLPYGDLTAVRKIAGVQRAEPLIVRSALWTSPRNAINPVRLIGFDPAAGLFSPAASAAQLQKLREPYTFLADSTQLGSLGVREIGDAGKVGGLRAKLVGLTEHTQPIVSPTFIYTTLETANAYTPSALSFLSAPGAAPAPLGEGDTITYILIKARDPRGIAELERKLETALPGTRALTGAQMAETTRSFWVKRTSIGFLLSLIAVLGLIVGIVVVGQILYTSVNEHLREYGTLKAIGTSDAFLYSVIIRQAAYMAILGYVPSLILTEIATRISAQHGVLILITAPTALLTFALAMVMCLAAGIFAVQRVMRADPAIVFRA